MSIGTQGVAQVAPTDATCIQNQRGWALAALLIGLAYGSLMGVGRIVQGAHFPSDVVWSWGVTFLTAAVLYYAMGLQKPPEATAKR